MSGGGGFTVVPSALDSYASAMDQRSQQLRSLVSTLTSMQVSQDAFGMIPGISDRAYQAYDQVASTSLTGLRKTADTIDGPVHDGIQQTAADYRDTDAALAGQAAEVEWEATDAGLGQGR